MDRDPRGDRIAPRLERPHRCGRRVTVVETAFEPYVRHAARGGVRVHLDRFLGEAAVSVVPQAWAACAKRNARSEAVCAPGRNRTCDQVLRRWPPRCRRAAARAPTLGLAGFGSCGRNRASADGLLSRLLSVRRSVRGHTLTAAGPFDGWTAVKAARAVNRRPMLRLGLDRRPAAVRTIGRWEGMPGSAGRLYVREDRCRRALGTSSESRSNVRAASPASGHWCVERAQTRMQTRNPARISIVL